MSKIVESGRSALFSPRSVFFINIFNEKVFATKVDMLLDSIRILGEILLSLW